jgi:hypothetical protein
MADDSRLVLEVACIIFGLGIVYLSICLADTAERLDAAEEKIARLLALTLVKR